MNALSHSHVCTPSKNSSINGISNTWPSKRSLAKAATDQYRVNRDYRLTQCSLGLQESPPRAGPRFVQPCLHSEAAWQTDWQTTGIIDHSSPYLEHSMQPRKLNNCFIYTIIYNITESTWSRRSAYARLWTISSSLRVESEALCETLVRLRGERGSVDTAELSALSLHAISVIP